MKLTWFGHSCFKLESADGVIVFDPSENGRVPGYDALPKVFEADEVLCSHGHGDHNAADLVQLSGKKFGGGIKLVDSWHDEAQGTKRGSNKIAVVETEGLKVVHMGDIGCELDDVQSAALASADVLMIPVGGFYTVDAKTARSIADKLGAKVVVPMHYRSGERGYDVIATVDEFLTISENVKKYADGVIEITAETEPQTAHLGYKGKF